MLELLEREVADERFGGVLVTERLTEVLLVEALRVYLDEHGSQGPWAGSARWPIVSWATASSARLMHADVTRRWTVDGLAAEVGMSRSAFSARFTRQLGLAPLAYLRRWRMVRAQRKLSEGADVANVAAAVGYTSQSAFSHAFKRICGHTPRSTGLS